MNFEYMYNNFSLADRLDYYAQDIEAAADMLDNYRIELQDREADKLLRVILLAFSSIADSLDQEAKQIRESK